MYPRIGIRPIIDGRQKGVRESLEDQTMRMAQTAKDLIESELFYPDGTHVECVIAPCTIGGGAEAYKAQEFFSTQNVCATLSVTPCWCYGSETMDLDPLTIKAVWGFNGTERPGAVYLAAAMAAHTQRGLPAFAIYGHDVQEADDTSVPDDVREKILRFARCAVAVGCMRNKAYVNIGGVAMGIGGSYCNSDFFQKYLGIRAEWVDMTEVLRRINLEIYDHEEFERAYKWTMDNCPMGFDKNADPLPPEHQEENWEFVVKMTLVIRDIMLGNDVLAGMDWLEESRGRNAILAGFQGQRQWTDWLPNGDFSEAEDLTDDVNWKFLLFNGGEGSAEIRDNMIVISSEAEGTEDYSVQLVQPELPMIKGKKYRATFDAYADEERDIVVCVSAPTAGWIRYLQDTKLTVTPEKQTFTYDFEMKDKDDPNGRLEFNLGHRGSTATVYISNVRVEEIS